MNKKSGSFLIYSIFLLSPIVSIVIMLRSYRTKIFANLIWMFSVFAGFAFVIGNEGSDINRYKDRFLIHSNSSTSLLEFCNNTLLEGNFDIIQPFLSFVVSRFTKDFRIYLGLIGFIYGYFFSRNLFIVLNHYQIQINRYNAVFVLIFAVLFAFWDINVMRFTLAAQVFLYGWLVWNVKKSVYGFVFKIISIFLHFSFTLVVIISILHRLIPKNVKWSFVIYFVSIFISGLTVDKFNGNSAILQIPEIFSTRSDSYLNQDYAEKKIDMHLEKNFRGKYYQDSLKYGVFILMIYAFSNRNRLITNRLNIDLFVFSNYCLGFFNLLNSIPSMNRFLFVSYLFTFILFLSIFFFRENAKDRRILILVYPLLLFYLVVKIRIGFEFTSLFTYFGSPIFTAFSENFEPIIKLIK